MSASLQAAAGMMLDTLSFLRAFVFVALFDGTLEGTARLLPGSKRAALHTYMLAANVRTWDEKHYRAPSFGADIRANMRNLAVPGTGLSLAWAASSKAVAFLFLLVVHPLISLVAAVFETARVRARLAGTSPASPWLPTIRALYSELLLSPRHWFSLWRLNCTIVAEHSRLTGCPEYELEEKGTFLLAGERLGLPITPFLRSPARLVVKHRAIEGGMGIHFFRSFTQPGGDYIIQEALDNSPFVASLLPPDAPLSTLRVITGSRRWLREVGWDQLPGGGVWEEDGALSDFCVFTVVFRAGLAGASTDHKAICFNVDCATGTIGLGTSNQHWYALGLRGVGTVGSSSHTTWTTHPDTGRPVTGAVIPDFAAIRSLVLSSHAALVPHVPLIGWDVALTPAGPQLVEINISCNFFCGRYDEAAYTAFAWQHFAALEAVRRGALPAAGIPEAGQRTRSTTEVSEPEPAGHNSGGAVASASGRVPSTPFIKRSPSSDTVASTCSSASSTTMALSDGGSGASESAPMTDRTQGSTSSGCSGARADPLDVTTASIASHASEPAAQATPTKGSICGTEDQLDLSDLSEGDDSGCSDGEAEMVQDRGSRSHGGSGIRLRLGAGSQ